MLTFAVLTISPKKIIIILTTWFTLLMMMNERLPLEHATDHLNSL